MAALVLAPSPGAAIPLGTAEASSVRLPNPSRDWDYQIGGAFPPAKTVGTVVRDRSAAPSRAAYDVCYVNAFQTQPDERKFWRRDGRWQLILKQDGRPVVDGAWGEFLLDTRTAQKRARLARLVGRWIAGCARSGYDAVELDNLDSWSRSRRLLSRSDNVALARLLVGRAHRAGLAAAQKNWAELSRRGPEIGFDFAVAEQCARYHECYRYVRAYGGRVLVVEYSRRDFRAACRRWAERLPIVWRDVDVTRGGVNRRC